MSNHLSQDQISMWIAGRSTPEERRHGLECRECRAELERFHEPVSTFRLALQDRSDRESVPRLSEISAFVHRPRGLLDVPWRWAAAGVTVLLLTAVPIYKLESDLQRRAKAAEAARLMGEVNLHLSRTVPAPMEPVMALIPGDPYFTQSGEIQ